jgi:putative nucleotidyltransferase with HDIG domain
MRLIATNLLKPGMSLGKTVYNDSGNVLIKEKIPLTETMIKRLQLLGITYVYVEDPRTDDIVPRLPITEEIRKKALATIEEAFKYIQNQPDLKKVFNIEKETKRFKNLIQTILMEMKQNKELVSLLTDIYVYDDYTFSHSFNVTLYALALGIELKLSDKELEELGLGAILHDIGKMCVPVEILKKPGKLTTEEYELMKKHTEFGFEMLRATYTIPLLAAHCAYQHHERLDGSGYPRGLKGNDIHYFGRLLAIADVFDAVTSNRVYRRAMLPHEGLEILYSGAGTQFDKEMVEAFRKAVAVYPVGLSVELNDGRKGIVAKQNDGLSERPVVRILEEDGRELNEPYEINLKEQLNVMIVGCESTMISDMRKFMK